MNLIINVKILISPLIIIIANPPIICNNFSSFSFAGTKDFARLDFSHTLLII